MCFHVEIRRVYLTYTGYICRRRVLRRHKWSRVSETGNPQRYLDQGCDRTCAFVRCVDLNRYFRKYGIMPRKVVLVYRCTYRSTATARFAGATCSADESALPRNPCKRSKPEIYHIHTCTNV